MACERRWVFQRRACRMLGQARTTQRYQKRTRVDEEPLRVLITELACAYGGYGIPRILKLLRGGFAYDHGLEAFDLALDPPVDVHGLGKSEPTG